MDERPGALGLTREQTDSVPATAALAPSLHNSQPSWFRLGARLIDAVRPPHAVLRIGRGWPGPATPRRPVADTLDGIPR